MAITDTPPRRFEEEPIGGRTTGRSTPHPPSRIVVLMSLALLAWAIVEAFNLATRHTTGPELYGVLVAILAVVAASVGLLALRGTSWQTWLTIAVAILWAIIALGGVAGLVAHIVGPVPGEGPIDLRPRPVLAPLAFTAMGIAGELVLWIWRRRPAGAARNTRSEVAR